MHTTQQIHETPETQEKNQRKYRVIDLCSMTTDKDSSSFYFFLNTKDYDSGSLMYIIISNTPTTSNETI